MSDEREAEMRKFARDLFRRAAPAETPPDDGADAQGASDEHEPRMRKFVRGLFGRPAPAETPPDDARARLVAKFRSTNKGEQK